MVQVAGIRVGRVDEHRTSTATTSPWTSTSRTPTLGDKTKASVEVLNLLGEKYLDLTPKGSGEMDGGATIPVSRTDASYDIVATLSELTTTTEAHQHPAAREALTTLGDTINAASPHIRSTFTGLSRLSQAIATRDDDPAAARPRRRGHQAARRAQGRPGHPDEAGRPGLPGADREPQAPIHTLLVNAGGSRSSCAGVATDNQAQIGDALKQLDTALTLPARREKQIDETMHNLGPYASILINIIGTGPWFDAYVPNLVSLGRPGEFAAGKRPELMNALLRQAARSPASWPCCSCWPPSSSSAAAAPTPAHVTAHFSRAVSIYKGSEVRVMGVHIGTVTAVVPEGDRVRVEMDYDAEYKLPADAKAAIVTPTLTADRFVQLAPGVHRRAGAGGRRRDRAAGDRHAGRARPDLPEPLRPDPGARAQRRQQERRPDTC